MSSQYLDALRKLYARLESSDVNWAVTGSLGFRLQGVPVEPHDIDIQMDRVGAYEIERLFPEFVVESVSFSSTEKIRSHFGVLAVEGIRVEVMGDIQKRLEDGSWEDPVDPARHRRFVQVEGMRIPVLSLEYEHQAYLRLGRVEKAALLMKYLQKAP